MFMYRIERPCLWFCKGDKIEIERFKKYYTNYAIQSLIEFGYIKIIEKEK